MTRVTRRVICAGLLLVISYFTTTTAVAQEFPWNPWEIFATYSVIPLGISWAPDTVEVLDLNGDGHLDLVATTADHAAIEVHLGNGDGTFTAMPLLTPMHPTIYAKTTVGDVNNDGKLDVVALTSGESPYPFGLTTFLGNGDGAFFEAFHVEHVFNEAEIALVDANDDGNLDVVLTPSLGLLVQLGDGAGGFTPFADWILTSSPISAHKIAVAEFNGDGRDDLLIMGQRSSPRQVEIMAALSQGDGTFTFGSAFVPSGISTSISSNVQAYQLGDFDNDGEVEVDLAVGLPAAGMYYPETGRIFTLHSLGDGSFSSIHHCWYAETWSPSIVFGDFTGDGRRDMVAILADYFWSEPDGHLSLAMSYGDDWLDCANGICSGTWVSWQFDTDDLVAGDFNEDGALDLIGNDIGFIPHQQPSPPDYCIDYYLWCDDVEQPCDSDPNYTGCCWEADTNGSCAVDSTDLAVLLGNFGMLSGATHADGDVDYDGDIDSTDLARMLNQFGRECYSIY